MEIKNPKELFEDIRERPYRVALSLDKPADNCYFKGIELIDALVSLGFSARARVGEFSWSTLPIPEKILELLPSGKPQTHFYPEIMIDGEWKILDPSFNKKFAITYDLPYSEFGEINSSCFQIERLYSFEEQEEYMHEWLHSADTQAEYKRLMHDFLTELNKWLEKINPCP